MAQEKIDKSEIAAIECRFAVHCGRPDGEEDDLHMVKEIIHTKDGRQIPNMRPWPNFKRPFYITKPAKQKHKEKKEWEDIDNLRKFECYQSDLKDQIALRLGFKGGFRGDLRKLLRSPYVYGADMLSTALIKRKYRERFPDTITPYVIAPMDSETDVLNEKTLNHILMLTVSCGSKVVTAVQKRFFGRMLNIEERLREAFQKYLGAFEAEDEDGNPILIDLVKQRNLEWELHIVDEEIDVVRKVFEACHRIKPDFLTFWNVDFDMTKILEACKRANVDPAEIFSDPSVPDAYKFAYYKRGPEQKRTSSGKVQPLTFEERWHTMYAPASFYVIDAACVYKRIRIANGKEPSYSLDAVLDKNLGMRKLKFKECEGFSKVDWHIEMQSKYQVEYVIYNVFDCIGIELLDEKTLDLRIAMPSQCGDSDFADYKSQPRRVVNELDGFVQQYGKIMATTSDEMKTDLDDLTVSPEGWIVTLPAHLVYDNGLKLLEEYPDHRTNVRGHVGDLDVAASYPNGGAVFNTARETTATELCRIQGIPEDVQRMQGINLSSGATNAVEYCCELYLLPDMETLLKAFDESLMLEQEEALAA